MNTAIQPVPSTVLSVAEAVQVARNHMTAGNRADVEQLCLKIMDVEPENAEALHMLGVLAHLAGKQGVALALLEKAVRAQPEQAEFRYNLGVVYGVVQQPEAAIASYREAVRLHPKHPSAWLNLGIVLLERDYNDEAIEAYQQHLQLNPHNMVSVLELGIALCTVKQFTQARPYLERAVAQPMADARAHWHYAHYLLTVGELARGWEEYEYRFKAVGSNVFAYDYPFARWNGEPLAGKTLLIHGEQGLGDEIMFSSIYAELIAEAEHVIICCQPHVAPLFKTSFPQATVHAQLRADQDAWTRIPVDWLSSSRPIDYQIVMGSLPRLRRRSLDQFPQHSGYLRTDGLKTEHWALSLGHLSGKRVGVCWAANPAIRVPVAAMRSRKKSVELNTLAPLFDVPDVQFVSLQTWDAARQVADALPSIRNRLLDVSGDLHDFSDTAALIKNLDLVITVDTAVAHLAGALGKPVWILLPWQCDWRWHENCDTTEWYPSAHLFRQPALHDWTSVVGAVQQQLAQWVQSGQVVAAV